MKANAIGPSWGGQTTKIHALTDVLGRPYVLTLTPGNMSDITAANDLIDRAGPSVVLFESSDGWIATYRAGNGYAARSPRRRAIEIPATRELDDRSGDCFEANSPISRLIVHGET